jgi:very-short-patch-repair endonuclease
MLPPVLREQVNPALLRRASELRKHMTPAERIVWQELRGNRLGVHFRRQQLLATYIVDFYCHQARLVVEIDGSPHRQQQGYDQVRDSYLARFGIRVLRLADHSVRNDIASVICAIRDALAHSPPTPSPFPKGKGSSESFSASYPPHPFSGTERGHSSRH